jgi:hypothetical protein
LLARCIGKTRAEVLKNASKLNAEERQALIKYFRVVPGRLAGAIIEFWKQTTKKPKTGLSNNSQIPL